MALFALSTFYPGDTSIKALDITALLEKTQDHGKSNPLQTAPPSLPVALPESRVDPRLR